VANLSHPGGNVTGIFVRQIELAAKRVEIAREAFPHATLVGIASDTLSREQGDAAAEAARKLGLEPRMVEVKGEQGYAGAFGTMDDARGQPIILPAGPIFLRDRAVIAQSLIWNRPLRAASRMRCSIWRSSHSSPRGNRASISDPHAPDCAPPRSNCGRRSAFG
jgi:hypothetical protein